MPLSYFVVVFKKIKNFIFNYKCLSYNSALFNMSMLNLLIVTIKNIKYNLMN